MFQTLDCKCHCHAIAWCLGTFTNFHHVIITMNSLTFNSSYGFLSVELKLFEYSIMFSWIFLLITIDGRRTVEESVGIIAWTVGAKKKESFIGWILMNFIFIYWTVAHLIEFGHTKTFETGPKKTKRWKRRKGKNIWDISFVIVYQLISIVRCRGRMMFNIENSGTGFESTEWFVYPCYHNRIYVDYSNNTYFWVLRLANINNVFIPMTFWFVLRFIIKA